MKIFIGTYELDQYCGGLVSSTLTQSTNDTTGKAQVILRQLQIEGEISGADQSAVDTEIESLETAVQKLGLASGDVGLTLNDGTTASQHWLDSSASVGGVRVVAFQWLPCVGSEYSTRRRFLLVVEAEFETTQKSNLLQFEDTLTTIGTGGAVFVYQPVIYGPWRQVTTNSQSTYLIVQRGANLGYEYAEPAATPLFNVSNEHQERRQVSVSSGQWVGGKKRNFRRSWSYTWEGNNQFLIPTGF